MSASFDQSPARSVAESVRHTLNHSHIHSQSSAMRPELVVPTPSFISTSVAASAESFYRSLMNSLINHRLTGIRGAAFPNMHVQLPTRVVYINGFKGIRRLVDENIQPDNYGEFAPMVRFGCAITPGVVMTPISSVLEACNANLNPEPLHLRWLRGISFRLVREVIFGIGLNQMSDHFQEFIPESQSVAARNALGSMIAGVVSGYLSHVPHNLSTMKLMHPSKSYLQHLQGFAAQRLQTVKHLPSNLQGPAAMTLAIFAPRGLIVRTTQVVGSFVLLNGIIQLMGAVHWNRQYVDQDQ